MLALALSTGRDGAARLQPRHGSYVRMPVGVRLIAVIRRSGLLLRGTEHQQRTLRWRPEQVLHQLLVEAALVRDVDEVPDCGAGAVDVRQRRAAPGHQVR